MDGSVSIWAVVKKSVREYFSPLRTCWFLIFLGAALLVWDIILRLSW